MTDILIIDTSILCVWLSIPGKDTCANDEGEQIGNAEVSAQINAATTAGSTLVLPLATIIETGNHIAQSNGDRWNLSRRFSQLVIDAAGGTTPWAVFSQDAYWVPEAVVALMTNWPGQAIQGLSLGDAAIVSVADYYARAFPRSDVIIMSGDRQLRSISPSVMTLPTRQR